MQLYGVCTIFHKAVIGCVLASMENALIVSLVSIRTACYTYLQNGQQDLPTSDQGRYPPNCQIIPKEK